MVFVNKKLIFELSHHSNHLLFAALFFADENCLENFYKKLFY